MRIALEDGEGLRARIIDAGEPAADFAEAAVDHLLLGAQETFLEAAAIADAQRAAGRFQRFENGLGVVERQCQRLFHQHRLAEFERLADRRGVLAFRRRDEHGVHLRMRDHLLVVGGMKVGSGKFGQRLGVRRLFVGDGEKAHGRVLGGEPRAQSADPARADNGDPELRCLHVLLPLLMLAFPVTESRRICMSARALEFVETWVSEKIEREGYPAEGEESPAKAWAAEVSRGGSRGGHPGE